MSWLTCARKHVIPGLLKNKKFYTGKKIWVHRFQFFFHTRKTVIEQLSASSQVSQVHPPWVRWEDQHVPGLLQVALAVGRQGSLLLGTHLPESQAWRRAFLWQETPFSDRVSLWSWHLLPKKLSMNASPWRYKIGTEVKHLLISHVFTLEQPIDVHRVLLMNDETVPAF